MSERQKIHAILRRYGLHLQKGLGQHFLADEEILRRMAEALEPGADAKVIEIGAGLGNLTYLLSLSGASVTAIELDRRFVPVHNEIFTGPGGNDSRVEFVYEDALDFDYEAASRSAAADGLRFLITGNIPYQITSPLVMKILESGAPFERMALMMQREVAERLAASPGSRRNGSISIKLQYFCSAEVLFDVPSQAFIPPPEVESQVVRFTPRKEELRNEEQRAKFFELVDAAFAQRRKMLPNSVASAGIGYSKEQAQEALEMIGKSPATRAEDLGVREFMLLFEKLSAPAGA